MTISRIQLEPQHVAGVREVVPMDALTEFFGRAYATTGAGLGRVGVAPAGPPVALYTGSVTESVDVLAGFPVAEPLDPTSGLIAVTLPGGDAVVAIHTGPYDSLATTYDELSDWFTENGLTPASAMWEEYLVGPDAEPDPARWQTRIVFPIA